MQNFENLQGSQPGFEPSSRVSAVVAQTGSDAANVRVSLQRTNRKLRPAEVDRLCAAYQAGATVTALAKEFRIYHQTVRAHLVRRGVPIRLQPTPITIDQRDRVFAMRASGMLQREIAAELGCSARSVRRALAGSVGEKLCGHGCELVVELEDPAVAGVRVDDQLAVVDAVA